LGRQVSPGSQDLFGGETFAVGFQKQIGSDCPEGRKPGKGPSREGKFVKLPESGRQAESAVQEAKLMIIILIHLSHPHHPHQ
jgi:hypothetical protein